MGKLEDALENTSGSGGLGGAVGQGGVRLQGGQPGTSAEDQVAGEGTLPESSGDASGRSMPTSPDATREIPE